MKPAPLIIDYELLRQVERLIDGANSHDVRGAIRRYEISARTMNLVSGDDRKFCQDTFTKYERLLRQYVAGAINHKQLN